MPGNGGPREGFLFLTTLAGVVKRVRLEDLPGVTTEPFTVINVAEDDALGWARVTTGTQEVLLATSSGKMCIRDRLYGKRQLLEAMPPFLGGGDMIRRVTFDGFIPNELPWKFEAGTPRIAEAIGLGAAVAYLSALGMDAIHAHEQAITCLLYTSRCV